MLTAEPLFEKCLDTVEDANLHMNGIVITICVKRFHETMRGDKRKREVGSVASERA